MRRILVLVVAACGSGGSNQPAPASPRPPAGPGPQTAETPGTATASTGPAISAEVFCEHLARLSSECEAFAKIGLAGDSCVAQTKVMLTGEGPKSSLMAILRCVVDGKHCDDTQRCIASAAEDPAGEGAALRACNDHTPRSTGRAVGIPQPQWERRKGAGIATYRAARSTKGAPIEMCGVPAANDWLTTLRCDDGSQPIHNETDAERARTGNVGMGGRCGSIIDHYAITCPEASYSIFIDAYFCSQRDSQSEH